MKFSKLIFPVMAGLCLVFATSAVQAAPRVFFSLSATTPTVELAGSINPTVALSIGNSVTVYIWYKREVTADTLDGIGLDIASSNPIVSKVGDLAIANPQYPDLTTEQDEYRWGSTLPPAAATGTNPGGAATAALLVNDAQAVKVGGSVFGKNADPQPKDTVTATSRFASLTLQATANGTTQIRFGVGIDGISFTNSATDPINFGFGDNAVLGTDKGAQSSLADLTITVGPVIPEPSTFVLLGLGAFGLVVVRRRNGR